jgi:alpha 1,6-mannosyltransferase
VLTFLLPFPIPASSTFVVHHSVTFLITSIRSAPLRPSNMGTSPIMQSSRNRLRIILPAGALALLLLFLWSSPSTVSNVSSYVGSSAASFSGGSSRHPGVTKFVDDDILLPNSSAVLPNIPPRIWQIYTPFVAEKIPVDLTTSWVLHSPSYLYSILDDEGSRAMIQRIQTLGGPHLSDAVEVFDSTERWMLRGDLMRYVLLATKGGIYADADVEMVKPLSEWVPDQWKDEVRLIVGVEADEEPPVGGTTYPVQFATWTVAGSPGHPIFWTMIERILHKLRTWPKGQEITDDDILRLTGPAGWTEVIFSYLSEVTGANVTNKDIHGMREPRLFGDALVLPIDGFTTGVGHSGASLSNARWTMVRHHFSGSWRNGGG